MQKPKERKQKSQHTIFRPQGLIWCIPLTIEKSFFLLSSTNLFCEVFVDFDLKSDKSMKSRSLNISGYFLQFCYYAFRNYDIVFLFDIQADMKIYRVSHKLLKIFYIYECRMFYSRTLISIAFKYLQQILEANYPLQCHKFNCFDYFLTFL